MTSHIPKPVVSTTGYTIQCPICRDELDVDNSNAQTAERSRADAQIHLLCHIAWMTEESVHAGPGSTPGTL